MSEKIKLQPGDSVYYVPNKALGFLIESFIDSDGDLCWRYALRSGLQEKRNHIKVSIQTQKESKFLDSVAVGHLHHWKGKK